jgi:5'-nucleotidase/UDP-sugar diphosphatase
MQRTVLVLLTLLALPLRAADVTLLHFSDYHSHALPFYTDAGERGGIARAIGYLQREKRRGALVFSGGDTINKGAPAWSDKYGCAEWAWLNGAVDAMAFGNHDADYGKSDFDRCRATTRYPILGANVPGLDPYRVFERDGVRIGVFAIAGRDFAQLVKVEGFSFGDPIAAARETVRALRERERVHAVVMIGHEHAEDDYALAAAVPGIDVIFGSHSHLERELTRIEGTETWFISPGQYLTMISRIVLRFDAGRRLTDVTGALVPVDARMREHRGVARRVRRMQRALERDPAYRELFVPIATLETPVSTAALAARTLSVMKRATGSDVALSTTSSFRRPLVRGVVTLESLRASLPYDNAIVVCAMPGSQLQRVLDFSRARSGTDSHAYVDAPGTIDPAKTYRVATTDYLANVAYREVFTCEKESSGLRVRDELRKSLE